MRFWRPLEIARRLAVSDEQVRRWLRSGALVGRKLGTQWRVGDDVLLVFIRERLREAGAAMTETE